LQLLFHDLKLEISVYSPLHSGKVEINWKNNGGRCFFWKVEGASQDKNTFSTKRRHRYF